MKILYVAAEISPFARMTNTADLLRFLPASLQDQGYEIRILLPKYGTISDRRNRLHEVIRLSGINVEVGEKEESMKIKVASIPNAKLQVYFLDNETYFEREALFHDPDSGDFFDDNDERIVFYNKGVLETVKKLGWKPDIIHCHDWPAGLVPLLVKSVYGDEEVFQNSRLVYNLHHPQNEGLFDEKILDLIDLPEDIDRTDLMSDGKVDILKLGLIYSDHVVTGNEITDELDDMFDELDIEPRQIQGAPQDISSKFAEYYQEIAGEEENVE